MKKQSSIQNYVHGCYEDTPTPTRELATELRGH